MLQDDFLQCKIPHEMRYDFKKLKNERERRLMSLTEMAEEAGISIEALRMIESGKAPWKKAIGKVVAALDRTKNRIQDVVITGKSA